MSDQTKIPTLQELDHILHEAEAALLGVYVEGELISVDPEGYDPHHDAVFVSVRGWHHNITEVKEVMPNGYLCATEKGKLLRITFKESPPDVPLSHVLTLIEQAEER